MVTAHPAASEVSCKPRGCGTEHQRVCSAYVDPIAPDMKYKLFTEAYKAHMFVPDYVFILISPLS